VRGETLLAIVSMYGSRRSGSSWAIPIISRLARARSAPQFEPIGILSVPNSVSSMAVRCLTSWGTSFGSQAPPVTTSTTSSMCASLMKSIESASFEVCRPSP